LGKLKKDMPSIKKSYWRNPGPTLRGGEAFAMTFRTWLPVMVQLNSNSCDRLTEKWTSCPSARRRRLPEVMDQIRVMSCSSPRHAVPV
jgi:hypothetical protein